jgi:ADP-ribosylglycohydrolase
MMERRDSLIKIPSDYIEKVYAGWLGKVIGVRHGGNIEGWTYDRIERTFGEITTYLHQFKNFAADDDTNGPVFFLRALEDFTHTEDITAEQMGLTWLNYAPDGHGFFWWGGYGKSTEHTAYLNLKNGIMAPRSGSIAQNGPAVAEQIGGQIFIDVWGLIAPAEPELAAQYAEKIASVSHDGEGKYGGMFIAACVAEAFTKKGIERIIEAGLSVIPEESQYARMTKDLIGFYKENPSDWRKCFQFVYDQYGYDRYPGACHVIPNSAVVILSLLYGEGDFSKSINICNMCGWDTDCNVANVGTIIGVRNGLEGIDPSWREPINDFLCCSSVVGTLNLLDIPWFASYVARLGYRIAGEEPPEPWREILGSDTINLHFEYPGSTHAFRLESDMAGVIPVAQNTDEAAFSGNRSLKLLFDYANGGFGCRAYVKTYYGPEDFNDSRYDPSFSPLLYPGQTIECRVMIPEDGIAEVNVRLYVKDRNAQERRYGPFVSLKPGEWEHLVYTIPPLKNVCLEEAGIELLPVQEERRHLQLPSLIAYMDDFKISGKPDYAIDFAGERIETWNPLHNEVSQFTYLRGLWTLEDGELSGSYHGEPAECYTGHYQWENYRFQALVIPKSGSDHRIQFRVQGGIRSYAVGLAPEGTVRLYKNSNGYKELASASFPWQNGEIYTISVETVANRMLIMVNGLNLLNYTDEKDPYLRGQIGFSNANGSHTHYKSFQVEGL